MSETSGNKNRKKSSLREFLTKPIVKADSSALKYSGLGVTLAVTILVFLGIGMWLDGKLSTGPWLTLAFALVGFAAGFYSFYLNIKKMSEEDKKENPKFNKY